LGLGGVAFRNTLLPFYSRFQSVMFRLVVYSQIGQICNICNPFGFLNYIYLFSLAPLPRIPLWLVQFFFVLIIFLLVSAWSCKVIYSLAYIPLPFSGTWSFNLSHSYPFESIPPLLLIASCSYMVLFFFLLAEDPFFYFQFFLPHLVFFCCTLHFSFFLALGSLRWNSEFSPLPFEL